MKRSTSKKKADKGKPPAALAALQRAARNALDLARRTGTPAYVLENGKIVDLAKRRVRKAKPKAPRKAGRA